MNARDDYRGRAGLLQLGRDLVDAFRGIPDAIAAGLHEIAEALPASPDVTIARALAAEELLVRHLGVEHMGRWVLIPGRPNRTAESRDPAGLTVAGRLVGLEPGEYPQVTNAGVSRTLILLQGGRGHEHLVPVDAVIRVGPREWS